MGLLMRQRILGAWFGIRMQGDARDGNLGKMLVRSGVVRRM